MSGSKDGAWRNGAAQAAGVDAFGNEHVLNTDITGTLEVTGTVTTTPSGTQDVNIINDTSGIKTDLNNVVSNLQTLNSLVPTQYDYIALSYTGSNLTQVVYKLGGVGGTIVSTLTLAYSGSNLISVTKS